MVYTSRHEQMWLSVYQEGGRVGGTSKYGPDLQIDATTEDTYPSGRRRRRPLHVLTKTYRHGEEVEKVERYAGVFGRRWRRLIR